MAEKAPGYGADGICLVLEDSVPVTHRDDARAIVAESLPALSRDEQTVLVKVNPVGSDDLDADLRAIVRPGLAGIILPKVQSPDDVRCVDALLEEAESRQGLEIGSVEIVVLVETPAAAVRAFEIASSSSRVATLAVGTAANGDMARELGFRWTRGGLERLYLRSKIVLDARAAGRAFPFDGVWGDIADIDGLVEEAEVARQLGYRGKLVVHPKHVEPVNRVFTPSAEEVSSQRRLLAAFDQALADGDAAVVVDGQLVDYAMAATARDLLELAERVGVRD
jgi:citrate lyase subunit beta/citryl-CoA lyase